MAKWCLDAAIDLMLANIATCTNLTVCSAQPANYAGIAAVTLATVVLTAGDGGGDYTISDGISSGRRLQVLIQSGISITGSGDATHIALDDGAVLRYVTTCTTQTLTSGGTVTVPEWDVEVADPA